MAYDKEELKELSFKAIKRHKVAKTDYLIPYLPCSQKTFYNHGLHLLQSIKDALFEQRVARKTKLVKRWEESENATLNIAAFKLLADDDELERLQGDKKTEIEVRTVQVENREKGLDEN